MENEAKSPFGGKYAENKPLHNFTIPKIKRDAEKVCFVSCMPNRREFKDILDTLNKGRLNMGCELDSLWNFTEMKLVINNDLEQNFFEKRSEMKELGRHGRELEEKFCFLVVPCKFAKYISRHGLTIGSMATIVLGNPEMGAYLFRHIDVALNFAYRRNMVSNVVMIFKVLIGKVKKVQTNSAMKVALDPTPNFDSHVSRKAPLWNDSLDEQVTNSLIYMYEYDSSLKPVKTPRQCLPIASVNATFKVQKSVTTSVPVRLPSKSISSGNDTFANCTVVQRIGKGKDATIIFKSARPPLLTPSGREISQNNCSEKEAQAVACTDMDQSSDILVTSTMIQNEVTVPGTDTSQQHITVALEGLMSSCMVITSKSMKDPRLIKRSEQEAFIPVDQYLTGHEQQNSLPCENEVSSNKEKDPSKENFDSCKSSIDKTALNVSFEEMRFSDNIFMTKEQLMQKLKKYSSFLSLNQKEREAKIQSLQRLSNEEKAGLSRKLGTYDKYYRMFAKHLRVAKGEQVKSALSTEKSPSNCSQLAVSGSVSMPGCNTKIGENGHLQNKCQLLSTGTNRGQSVGSQCTSQEANQKIKAPERKRNSLIENNNDEPSPLKNHVVNKSNVVTSKAEVLQTGQSSVTDVNGKGKSPAFDKGRIYKAKEYHTSRNGTQNVKSQRAPIKDRIEKDVAAEINVTSSDLKSTSQIADSLSPQKIQSQKTEEKKCTLKKSPEKKIQKLHLRTGDTNKAEDLKKAPTSSTKQITATDKYDEINSATRSTKGLDTKSTNEKHNFLHSSYKVGRGTTRKEICETDSSVVAIPTQASMLNKCIDVDLVTKNICRDNAIETLHSEKLCTKNLPIAKNTCLARDMVANDLCVIELEKRIAWKSIFGMEIEKANAPLGELQNPLLRREKEPSGMRIFPDMEITVINSNYVSVDSCVNKLVGEMHPSMVAKEQFNKTFQPLKTVSPNCHRTDQGSEIQIATTSPISQDCKSSFEDNLKPLSTCIKVGKSIPADDKAFIHNQVTAEREIDSKSTCVKTSHPLNRSTVKKRLNNKRIPSVPIKKSVRRISKFSQSEESIKVALGMLSDEIPLCKNKRISKKLDRAILHLRKAHKRVQKSLQLVAKVGKRRNVSKTCSVQENPNTKSSNAVTNLKPNSEGIEIKAKQVESSELECTSRQMLPTPNSSNAIVSEEQQPKSLPTDRNYLSESTQVINAVSTQDSQLTKNGGVLPSAKKLPSFKSRICSSEDHSDASSVIISNKENAVPIIYSMKAPSESKAINVENCETDGKDNKLPDTVSKGKHTTCTKRMFSQVRKQNSSHTKTMPKCSKKKSSSNESSQLKRKRIKESASVTAKSAKIPSLLVKLSDILQKASETHSLRSLQYCKFLCLKMLPVFIKSFEKKQQCVLKDVIVDRRLFVEQNLKTCFKCALKPQAIEVFLEFQMMMETSQFIENKMHYIEGRPTFRSLLWYDGSLYTELLMGDSGYQQQSNFYTAFQEKLKHDALAKLENHCTQLSEFLQAMHEKNSCCYVYLKYKRELKECEDVLKHPCDHSAFSLSLPFSCGVHLGDTIDDLAALQKSTLEIISTFINLPKFDSGKKEHALCLLEIISAKIDFIKTSVSISMQVTLFGIEHLLFDAAKVIIFKESKKYSGQKKNTLKKEFMAELSSFALTKYYEVYWFPSKETRVTKKEGDMWNEHLNSNRSLGFSTPQDVFFVGKIIDQARCAEFSLLKQMIQDCKQQLESQIKCFQILQECDIDEVLIRESNVLEIAPRQDQLTTLLKTEAVEPYIELVMTYETLHFLNCLIASKKTQERTRGLLWYDSSLLSDLLHNQDRLGPFLQGNLMPNAIDIIDSTISDIKSELEIISDCSNSVNYSYAFQIMTRELSELSDLKNFVLKSKSAVNTYIHFSPYVVSLHYGSSSTELDYNYNKLSHFLGLLMSTPKKDLGKMAHTMKIMRTIELTKASVFKGVQSTFHLVTCQILQNRIKHDQDIVNTTQKESRTKMLKDQSSRKRMSTEGTPSFNSKRQKVIKSSGKCTKKEREENQVNSTLRTKTPIGMSITVLQRKDQSAVKKDCMKGSLQKDSKTLALSSPKYKRRDYVKDIDTDSEINKTRKKDSKSNPSSHQDLVKIKKSLEASNSSDICGSALQTQDQAQADSKCALNLCSESIISSRPGHENANEPSDDHAIKIKDESSLEKDTCSTQPSTTDNVTSMNKCSMGTDTSEEQKNPDQANSTTEEQEGKQDKKPIQNEMLQCKHADWNSQPMSAPYLQVPGSTNPWHYSLYLWYQNSTNTSVMSQGYHGGSYNTQQTNPYNQSPAFPAQNSYSTNQPYSSFTSQIQAQMYPDFGPFGATMSYNYRDPSSASKQNLVPAPYSYNSTASTGWSWNSWQ